jgi:hypothetical protein
MKWLMREDRLRMVTVVMTFLKWRWYTVATCLLHLPPYNGSKCCTNLIYVSNLRVYYSFIAYYVSSDLGENFQSLLRLNRAT